MARNQSLPLSFEQGNHPTIIQHSLKKFLAGEGLIQVATGKFLDLSVKDGFLGRLNMAIKEKPPKNQKTIDAAENYSLGYKGPKKVVSV